MRKFIYLVGCLLINSVAWSQQSSTFKSWGSMGFSQNIDQPVLQISTSYNHVLALLADSTVAAWGGASEGQIIIPPGLTRIRQVAAGSLFSLVLKSDGSVVAWGRNANGETSIPAGIGRVRQLSAGSVHTCALLEDSTVVAWGWNRYGQTQVPAGLRKVVAVESGSSYCLALKSDSTIAAWGDNTYGQCSVPRGLNKIVAMAAGDQHALALKADGSIVAWGSSPLGQLNIPAGLDHVVAIAAGRYHSLALKSDGTVTAWGLNSTECLDVPPGLANVKSIECGSGTSFALKTDGSLVGWGVKETGETVVPHGFHNLKSLIAGPCTFLGIRQDSTPVIWGANYSGIANVPSGLSGIKAMAASADHVLALKTDSTVIAWGNNDAGQTDVLPRLRKVVAIAAGYKFSMVLKDDSTVEVWGYWGSPLYLPPAGLRGVIAIAAGQFTAMALKKDGTVVSWIGASAPRSLRGVVSIAAGRDHCLALKADGTVTAWSIAINSNNQVELASSFTDVVAISAGGDHSAFLMADGQVKIIGYNNVLSRVTEVPRNLRAKTVSLGADFSLALEGELLARSLPFRIFGSVFRAGNANCVQDSGETPLAREIIVAHDSARHERFFAFSDSSGKYTLSLDSGLYQVSAFTASDVDFLQRQVCPPAGQSYSVNFSGRLDTASNINFALDEVACPRMLLSIGANRRRPCFRSTTLVSYSNIGYAPQAAVRIRVKLPPHVFLLAASHPYTVDYQDTSYVFNIGTVQAGNSGQIQIIDSVACIPGWRGTLCTYAWLTPRSAACSFPPNYDGSAVSAKGFATNGVPTFVLKNDGRAMSTARRFRVWQDSLLAYEQGYQLAAGDSLVVSLPHGHSLCSITLQVEQDSLSPEGRWQNAQTPTCGLNPFSAAAFPPPISPLEATDCQAIRNSYDPNDKQVQPAGLTAAGNVEPGTWLRYRIRFMNKGTDTAYTVRIVDTLSESVDIASLRFGASSHRYIPTLSGKGRPVLTFRFTDINLPDSIRSGGTAAQGFVDFTVRTLPTGVLGTEIRNFADIYFDYNDPVRTNTTLNTLYRPTVVPGLIDTLLVSAKPARQALLRVEPNPAHTGLRVFGAGPQPLELLNAEGRRVLYHPSPSRDILLNIESLPVGLYLLRQGPNSIRVVKE